MRNSQKGFIVPVLLFIIALVVIVGGLYYYNIKNTNSVPTPIDQTTNLDQNNTVPTPTPNPKLNTYSNFGITFKYPIEWGTPKESFYDNGFGSISFGDGSSNANSFSIIIQQDTNPEGTLINETLDQMIARFNMNNKNIHPVNISAGGVQGKEVVYNSAVTKQPYHVDAFFPFQNNFYITLGADYQSVSQATFDSIISSFKLDNTTAIKLDSATGMAIYSNNGIRFEYPLKFTTDYASLNIQTSVQKVENTKLDSNGCYPGVDGNGTQTQTNVINVNGIKFCSTSSSDVGAGQLYTDYTYATIRNGNVYTVNYSVHTSNGCGAYKNSESINSPENKKYNECLNAQRNFDTTVVKPIKDSISTFTFTN